MKLPGCHGACLMHFSLCWFTSDLGFPIVPEHRSIYFYVWGPPPRMGISLQDAQSWKENLTGVPNHKKWVWGQKKIPTQSGVTCQGERFYFFAQSAAGDCTTHAERSEFNLCPHLTKTVCFYCCEEATLLRKTFNWGWLKLFSEG